MSKGGRPPAAPDYVSAAREQGRQNIDALRVGAALNRVNERNPFGSTTYTRDPNNIDSWTQTTTLSEDQQRLLDQSEQNQYDVGRIAGLRLGDVGSQGAFTLDGLPSQVTGVATSNLQSDVGAPSAEARARAEDAHYRASTRQLDPQFDRREDQLRTRLLNQGLREGSEGWAQQMADLSRDRDSAYGDARDRAIMAGGHEASRALADDLSRTGFANQTEQQRFGQALTNASLQNEGRAAGINERLTERDIPMREFLSLYGGGSYQNPLNPSSAANMGSPQPVDHLGAVNQQYGAQSDMYNWRQQRNAQNVNTGISLASLAALFAMSDRRAKTDIERVGELPNGIPTYRYRFKHEQRSRIGVMSDDVRAIVPEAVIVGEDGYDRVNYSLIGAAHLLELI